MQTAGLKGARLSFQQARLWKWLQKSQSYRVQYGLRIEGVLDTERFQQALQQIVDRHSILSTTFSHVPGMDVPMQVIGKRGTVICPTIHLEELDEDGQTSALEEQFVQLQLLPFDLEHGPLLHTVLLCLAEQTHVLLLSLHALCADTPTLNVLASEFQQIYVSLLSGEQQDAGEEPLQYVNVSAWLNEVLEEDEEAEEQQAFWRKIDLTNLASMRLPFEQGEHSQHLFAQQTFAPRQQAIPLQPEEKARLQALSQRLNVSTSAILLAGWQVLLWRLTNESPLLGLACDGRPYEELAEAVGLYSRMVPLGLSLADQQSFIWVVEQTHQALQEASERQLYFSWDSSQSSQFFPVSFAFESLPQACTANTAHGLLSFSAQRYSSYIEPFLLQLRAVQADSQLQLQFDYQDGALSTDQMQQLVRCFQVLLQEALDRPQTAIELLPLLTAAEQELLQKTWTGPQIDRPFQPLHRLFEARAAKYPQQLAVICEHEQLSYQQLNEQANQLAHLLRRHGVGPNTLVGLCLSRSVQHLVAMLAVLKAGGAYVPLDPDLPTARLERLIEEIAAPVVLTQEALVSRLGSVKSHFFCQETLASQLASEPTSDLAEASGPQDLAYIIYTSGSTGQPKGVMIRQQSVSNYTHSLCDLLSIESGWHFACVSSLAADLGNTVIFCSLASGGCLHLLPYEMVTDGLAFSRYVREHPIDVLKIVPSHLRALLDSEGRDLLPSRFLILGGEALPWPLLEQLRALQADCQVINHYGPTETTIGTLVNVLGKVSQEQSLIPFEKGGSVPIGRPLPNTQAYVLDQHQQWVPLGAVGELYLGGMGLAAGYLHRPEQTQERFIMANRVSSQESTRLYRTGDLVRARADGKIEFVGRVDTQVKLRGFRIELGEIEAALRQHPGVREAVVGVYEEPGGEPQLVGYFVAWQLPGPSSDDLRSLLQTHLPGYMVPSAFVLLDRLPLTANGKIDRRRLPAPSKQESFQQRNVVAPRTPVEELLVGVWENLLGVAPIGVEENFFRLGGHSLMGTQMISRIRGLFGLEVPIGWLFELPTVAELAARLEKERLVTDEILPLVAVSRQQNLPLSFAQQRLWFLDQLEPGSSTYNIPIAVRFEGSLDLPALLSSVQEMVRRHEILRTHFSTQEREPHQVINQVAECPQVLIDLQALSADRREQVAEQLIWQEAQQPFDLAHGPLLRVRVLRLQPQSHVSLLTLHHIISDGWSSGILMGELSQLYTAFHEGRPSPLADLPLQYADYAVWQRQWLQGEVLAGQLGYWKQQLAGVVPLELPTDRPRPAIQTFHGATQSLILPTELSQQIKQVSQQEGVTLFMTLLAAFQVLLSRYSGQSDIAVGTPVANRNRAEIEGLIGFFVNTLVLRSDLSDNPSFRQLLAQVRENALQAYAHQDVPFEQVVEVLQPERDRSRSPLFQVLFVLQNTLRADGEFVGLTLQPLEPEQTTAKFDLTLVVIEAQDGLHCTIEYNTDLFEASSIQRLLGHWQTLLQGIVTQPEQVVIRLPFLTEEEHHTLRTWNATQQNFPGEQRLHVLFEEQVIRTPDAVALVYEDECLTYNELNRRANQLAHYLQCRGVGPEVVVGILLERSLFLNISLLGILKAGGAYVPLDPSYPVERLAYMLTRAHVQSLLTTASFHELVAALGTHLPMLIDTPSSQANREQVALSESEYSCLAISLDRAWNASQTDEAVLSIAQHSSENPVSLVTADNIAYVIYTSGSTGMPKGAMNTHRGICNRLKWGQSVYPLNENDRVLQKTPTSFDVSVWELFWSLLTGAQLVLARPGGHRDSAYLVKLILEKQITTLHFVPSMLQVFLEEEGLEQCHSVRQVMCSGEALSYNHQERFFKRMKADLHNLYGPTEAAVEVTAWTCLPQSRQVAVPIGKPISNISIHLLDEQMQPVPVGVPGELYIGGVGVARGYYQQPALTAERFVPNPFADMETGGNGGTRLYRTGDLARYLPDGAIEYLRRIDHQVKLRGFRIELGEIETALALHPAVRDCIVLVREDGAADKRLIAYVVSSSTSAMSVSNELRQFLQGKLPEYMVPSAFIMLDALPITPNGKVDRRALLALDVQHGEKSVERIAPRTQLEELLAEIWHEILPAAQAGIYDNFFESGGHSLLATQLVTRIRKTLKVDIALSALFEAPTIAGLGKHIEQKMREGQKIEELALVPVSREQDIPLTFAQQRMWFLDQLEPNSAAYNMPNPVRLSGLLDVAILERSLEAMVQRHETLHTSFQSKAGNPVQIIDQVGELTLPLVDLRVFRPDEREKEARRLAQQEALRPFNLSKGPLFRTRLLRLDNNEHIFLLTLHHIISDGWSQGVFMSEISRLYNAFLTGAPSPLATLPLQYADYAVWQRQWLQGEVLDAQLRYWTNHLTGITPLELPTDRPRPFIQTSNGAHYEFVLPASLSRELKVLSQREGVTLFMTLLAAFQVLLMRYSGQQDIALGTLIANRTHEEMEHLIGCFINTLVLRTDLSGNPSFQELLTRVREVTLGAYAHQDMPFEKLVDALQPERDLSRSPLFQVMFVLQNTARSVEKFDHLVLQPLNEENKTAVDDIFLSVIDTEEGLTCIARYNTDLFDHDTVGRMLTHWQTLLEGIVAAPSTLLAQLPLLSQTDQSQILEQWNQTQRSYPLATHFAWLFSLQVAHTPTAIAAVSAGTTLTYEQLYQQAGLLALQLRQLGVGPDLLVGLYMPRSLELLIAIVGTFLAGGAYVPLDPNYPQQRIDYILRDAQVQVILTLSELRSQLPDSLPAPVLTFDLNMQAASTIADLEGLLISEQESFAGNQLAYLIYTSGSTGLPKGAMLNQHGMLNHLYAKIETLQLGAQDRIAQTASPSFDISIWQFLSALLCGAQVDVLPEEVVRDPSALLQYIQQAHIHILEVVPTMLQAMIDVVEQSKGQTTWSPALRWLVVTGEALPAEVSRRWLQHFPHIPLVNAYGPTECSDDVTQAVLRELPSGPLGAVPIGYALPNTRLYVLDAGMQPLPVGVLGEIYVGGDGVGRGYWRQAGKTAEVFVPDSFSKQPGSRLYKTGDLGRYRRDGQLEFVRRIDEQVKIRGYRIELGEIEAVLRNYSAVNSALVLVQQDAQRRDQHLVAYIVSHPDTTLHIAELRSFLKQQLPDYMVPPFLVVLPAWPLTPNGKIDRQALPAPSGTGDTQADFRMQAPQGALEGLLAQIWQQVLEREEIGQHENFFEAGGHSLLATQIIARIRVAFGVEVPLRAVFEAPTIAGLARLVEQQLRQENEGSLAPLVPVSREQFLPLSFAQQRLWFLHQMNPNNIAYNIPVMIQLDGVVDPVAFERSLAEIVRRHENLRTTFHMQDGQPVQVITPVGNFALNSIDLCTFALEEREARAREMAQQDARTSFDLTQGPLLRVTLIQMAKDKFLLQLTMHHIISDGWSMGVLIHELTTLYAALRDGNVSPLAELPIQYADYAVWQRQWLQGEVLKEHVRYWTKQLSEARALELPTGRPRAQTQSYRGARYIFQLSHDQTQALSALSRQEGVTLFMTLLTAFQTLLYRYTGQEDVVVGTDSANRSRIETEGLIGFFVNLLALRTNLAGNPPFRDVLRRVREMVLEAYAHQELPFEMVVEHLRLERQGNQTPLVNVLFVHHNVPMVREGLPGLQIQPIESEATTAKFDLALFILERPEGIEGTVDYSTDLFDASTIETMMHRFEFLLHNIVQHVEAPVDELEISTETEKTQKEDEKKKRTLDKKSRLKKVERKGIELS